MAWCTRQVYDKWRLPLDYKASFASMLRAMGRHDQLHINAETGIDIIYSPQLGMELADVDSSDQEEDLEEVISIRESKILALLVRSGVKIIMENGENAY